MTKLQSRIDLYHGANNYLYLRGNSFAYDSHILSAVLCNNFVDVRNVAYDYDVTKEFTWDFKELVEIKKRKRVVNRFYRPNFKLLERIQSAKKFEDNKKMGSLHTTRQILRPFITYTFFPDTYADKE